MPCQSPLRLHRPAREADGEGLGSVVTVPRLKPAVPCPTSCLGNHGRIYFHLSLICKEKVMVHLSEGYRDNSIVFLRCLLGVAHRKGLANVCS